MFWLLPILIGMSEGHHNLRIHNAETLKLKCDALPYRTFYSDRCLFLLANEEDLASSSAACTSVITGSVVETTPPAQIWTDLGLDPADFHSAQSSGRKKAICSIASKTTCPSGSELLAGGLKCSVRADRKMSYEDAASFCRAYDSLLPTDNNVDEHRNLYGALRNDAVWVRGRVSRTGWINHQPTLQSLTSCATEGSGDVAPDSLNLCSSQYAPTLIPEGNLGQAHLALSETNKEQSVICLSDATSDFWSGNLARVGLIDEGSNEGKNPSARCKSCIEDHEYNPDTNECEWTGPRSACVKLVNDQNAVYYYTINGFPKENGVNQMIELANNTATATAFNDRTVRAVVRRGCRATFWAHELSSGTRPEERLLSDVWYGSYAVPSFKTGTRSKLDDGLSRVKCICYTPLPNIQPSTAASTIPCKRSKACVDQHEYDQTTNECEWTGPANACVKIFNGNNDTWYHTIPGFPKDDGENVESLLTRIPTVSGKFDDKTVRAVVRRGCRATFWAHDEQTNPRWRLVNDVWYGSYYIPSFYTGNLENITDGLSRIRCVCYAPLPNQSPTGASYAQATPVLSLPERTIATIEPRDYISLRGEHLSNKYSKFNPDHVINRKDCVKWKKCVEDHEYNEASDQCEWTGPRSACVKLINNNNEIWYHEIPGFPQEDGTKNESDLSKIAATATAFNEKTVRVVVRTGCRATFWSHPLDIKNGKDPRSTLLYDVWYGSYKMPSYQTGELTAYDDGLSRVKCLCYPPLQNYRASLPSPPVPKAETICASHKHCVDQHEYDPATNQCEWTGPTNACVKLYTDRNESIYHTIPGFPTEDGSKIEMNLQQNPTFNEMTTRVVVRRGCRATFYADEKKTWILLNDAWYGSYFMPSYTTGTLAQLQDGLTLIKCTCYPPLRDISPAQ